MSRLLAIVIIVGAMFRIIQIVNRIKRKIDKGE